MRGWRKFINFMHNKDLKRRIIEISYELALSHLGSCLTALDIIADIYKMKHKDEPFILSAGHAHLAHACVMEKYGIIKDARENIVRYGIHCERSGGCDASTGSLGQGLPIAVGMALADRKKNVYCLISDGECSEGSIFEAFRIMEENKLDNLKVYLNWNGWGAYREIIANPLPEEFDYLYEEVITTIMDFPFLKGQDAHYRIMSDEDYKSAMEILR
mgnify:CR=1 FL=1